MTPSTRDILAHAPAPPAPPTDAGAVMYALAKELFPINRSLTGDGFRESLRHITRRIPLDVHEVPTGTRVFDWTVPREWNLRRATITDSRGRVVVDSDVCNLHVLGYSMPVRRKVSLAELQDHVFTLPDKPDWVPYRTSYYKETWGFCLTHNHLQSLPDDDYDVHIDATLADGHLTYGECLLPGNTDEEVLFSCHACHPSLANDNCSGMALATELASRLARREGRRYSYRFLFIPGTIGSITWLARNEQTIVPRIRHGLVVTCVGDAGPMTYKRSRRGDAEIDRATVHVLKHSGQSHTILDFSPHGYDERQYCSPGFNLPVGSLMRTPNGKYPEYHTSADNLDLVRPTSLADSLEKYLAVINVLEANRCYVNTNPKCEPQLGKRGLYRAFGGESDVSHCQLAMMWALNLSDGQPSHDLLGIAERSGLKFPLIRDAAALLLEAGLLRAAREDE